MNENLSNPTNSLGLGFEDSNLNSTPSDSAAVATPNNVGALAQGSDTKEVNNAASQQAVVFNSGNVLDFSNNTGDVNTAPSLKANENLDQSSNFGESQVNGNPYTIIFLLLGMKVTLLDLQESEKDAVRAKVSDARQSLTVPFRRRWSKFVLHIFELKL